MMPANHKGTECPSPESLEAYSRGDLSRAGQSIAEHVAGCNACQSEIARIAAETALKDPRTKQRPAAQSTEEGPLPLFKSQKTDPTALLEPSDVPFVVAGYDIRAYLGGGADGEVFAATEHATGKPVVLRMFVSSPGMNARSVERAIAESAVAAQQTDNRLLPIIHLAPANELVAMVLPFVDGPSLADIIKERRRILKANSYAALGAMGDEQYVSALLKVLRQLVQTLAALHSRDRRFPELRSSSVLVDAAGSAFLADRGLGALMAAGLCPARMTSRSANTWAARAGSTPAGRTPRPSFVSPASQSKSVSAPMEALIDNLHTLHATRPGFISPEEWRAERDVGAAADVFRLGVIMYQALTLHLPFGIAPLSNRTRAPMPPKHLQRLVPAPVDEIIMRCLATRKADRFRTAADIVLPDAG
jgi:serine/threonine protein kinase